MNKSQKILVALFFLSSIGMANHGRYEQYWSDYEDFANNRGKFKIGQKGVIVYKKEGLGEAATIEQPIPNFDGMVDGGAYALWGDPQILSTASHVGNWGSFTFIQRHLRKDVELSEGFKNKANTNKDSIVQEYSERVKMPYMRDLGNDYSIGRLKTIAFDGYTPETIKNRNQIHYGDLVARTGGGVNSYAQDGGERYPVGYGNIAGGLNKIYHIDGGSGSGSFWIQMNKKFQTPLDSASRPGDSGSPAYIWDKDNNKWLLAGENSAGSGDNNWNKKSIIKQNPDAVNAYLKSIEDEKITDANVTLKGKTLGFGNSTRVIDDNVATAKNQTFAKNGLTLTVNSDSDTGASRFRFSENANITGTGKFNTAGLIIDKNVNVNYNIISDKNTVIRKRGEGSLTLNGNSKNDVEVNIGEGSLILDNSNGYAASHIRVAQGAKVILNKDNQLNDNKIYFGHRGGILELKGQNLEFNDIYHLDKDAIIANKESTTKSKFTFTQGKDRVFLGKFSGNMDVEYNPNEVNENSKWNLRGNTDITGDLNVKKGIVSISGDVITSGYENNVLENQFEKTIFKAGNINVDNGSTLQLDRATKVDSNINVSGKLDLTATGEVLTKLDKTKPYKDYEDQSEVNKVNVNGNITFKNGVSNNFNANVENNNLVEINSKMSGTINGEKTGNGLLKINNSNNDFSGNLTIKNGAVESENENILSNGKYKIEEKGLLRVNNNSNFNVLDKIDKSSTGVISLGNSLAELDKKYSDYTNLYIGSKNDITIGANDKAIDKSISNINLGGDNGTVTLKGLELEDGTTVRNINAGNDKHRGNVVIDGLSNDAKVNITIRDGINFVVNNNRSNSQFLNLGYGATAGTSLKNNLKDASIGVLELTNENSIDVKNVAIGAKKGSDVTLNTYTTTNDKTRFSGEGNLTYTATLENKELEVDAQNLSGGVVTLTGDNKNFTNKVTVMGNKNGVNNGSITLKLGSEMLKHKNEVLIKDGGILDINDNDVSIKLNNASNKYGTLTNSGVNKANVTIDNQDKEFTTINTTLTGNLNIVKQGKGTLKFDNKNNFKGNVVMNGGELIYDKDVLENDIELNDAVTINKRRLLSGKEITTEKHAITKLTISTNKSNGDIKSSFGMINVKENANININSITVLKGHDDEFEVYRHLNINGKSRDKGTLNIGKVTIADGAKMYVSNQRMTMQSLEAKDNSILTLDNASLKLVYSENTILNSGLKELELTRSKLYLRDYSSKINDKNSDKLTKVVINASNKTGEVSEIINGENINDNGGGGGATFVNPILLKKSATNVATLIFKSGGFFGSGTGLTINSKVSGEGVIKFERNNGAKFEIQDNFKEFNGKVMSNNQPNVNYDYNISSDNAEDRVIGYNLTGIGSYTNKSNKDLTFTNLSGFTGKLVAQNGDIVLKDEKAIDNTGKVETYNNTNITLLSDNNIDVTGINLENKNTSEGNTNKVIKDGSGKLSLGDNTSIVNFKIFEVKSGELELKKNIEVSNIDLKDSTKLDLNFITNGTITSEITGTGDLIKVGTTKIDIEGSKLNSTGSIDLQAGELSVTGNKVLSNKVKGNADLTFKNSNVEVKDIENFSGNLNLENSILTLKEDKSLNTDTKIIAKESSNIKLDLTSDKVLNKLNVENKGQDTNKIEKLGEAKLTLGENLNIKNFKNLDVKAGTLEISKNIPIENVNVDTNTKLNVNNTTNIEMTSNIKGAGDIVKLGEGKLSIASNKLNSEGNIDLQAGELSVTGNKVLSNKVKGNADLTFKNSNVEVKDIENFSGNLNLENSILTLKEDKSLNTDTKIIAKESSNIKLDLTSDKVLNKLNVENKGQDTNKIEKLGEAKLTLGENLNIKNFKNLDVKAGTLEISKNIPIENVNVDTNTKLNVNNTTNIEMTSNIKGAGDIVKLGEGKLSIASNKLNSEGNIDLQAGELSVTGNKVLSNKVKGNADLTFKNSNVEVKDIENFSGNLNLENSILTLKEDKSLNTDTKIIAKESSNIKLDLTSDKVLNKLNVENKGQDTNKIEKLGEAKLTLGENLNIKNFKNLDVKAGTLEISKNIPIENVNVDTNTKLNVNNTTNIEMTSNIKGSGDIVKLGEGKLSIASSKLNNLGNIEISSGKVAVNLDAAKVFENKLKGTGSLDVIASHSNKVEFKELKEFTGNINGRDVDITLNGDNSLNSTVNLSGTSKLNIINDKKYSNLTLNVENGKTVINSENKIDATINIKENSSLIINKDTNINKVNNEGTVVLENSKLHLDGYNSDKGIVDINLKNKVEGILDIKNSEKDVNVKVNMSNEVIEELKNTQLLLASSNKNVNILNLDDINKNLVRKLMFKSENNNYYIYSMLKSRDLSYSNIVNNLDSIYRNVYKMNYGKFIEARYTHQTIVDNKEKVFENSKYTTENNTDELGINGSYYIDKLNLGINLEYIHSRNSLSMKVVDGGSTNTNYSIHSLIAKTGYKKGIFDISARVGVSNISILYSEPENIKAIMNGLAIGINPEYRFNKNTLVKYVNEFGYENISLSGKYITKARLFNIYYKTGLSLNHKYIDLDLFADLRHVDNNTSTNKDVEIDVKNKYVEVNTLLKLTAKPTDSLRLNTEVELKFNQNKFAKYILNSGIQFRW